MSKAISDALHLPLTHLDVLAELGQEFAQSIDIGATLNHAVNRIAEYMDAEAASVFLVDHQTDQLECRACAGPVDVTGLRMELGQGIVGRAAKKNMCQLVRDARADPDFAQRVDQKTGFETRSILCTPLRSSRGVIGVIQVLNKRQGGLFNDSDRETLRVLASPTALAINNAEMASDLVEQKRLRKELFMARRLQRSLLPKRRPDPFPVQGINLPAREVSGDFFDFFELPDGRVGFVVGDVSGKGMNAALLMVRATSLLRWVGKSGVSPGDWLAQVNDELLTTVTQGMFICAVAGYVDRESGELVWANAGFPPPLRHLGQGKFEEHRAGAPPLAILEQKQFPEERVDLSDGPVYFYSDGVTEARSEDSVMLGEDGFRSLVDAHGPRPSKARLGAIVSDLRRLELCDDTTLVIVENHQ
ncbi:MAG: SpoIIE family protein phosphatase [Xanthomonadales bacterium]|nr:SpoIIE family protein phosphatase [Xanthomonadales bacterium]